MFGLMIGGCLVSGVIVFVLSFLISLLFTPLLRRLSLRYDLYAVPNHRSSHFQKIPNTGGVLLFFSIVVPVFVFSDVNSAQNFLLLALSYLVLFVVGVLDDVFNVSVKFKLLGQFLPAALILLSLATQNFILPFIPASVDYPVSVKFIFWLVAVVGIINAYNFIDGIDGLAIGLGILGGLLFGMYFYVHQYCNLAMLGFALSGGLLGLLRYNLSQSRKIFIGDTGSLIIGGIMSLFILRHLEINQQDDLNFSSSMVFGILFVPVSDLVRVVIFRLINRKSPFQADRTHVHHILMDRFSLNHRRTSASLLGGQVGIFLLFLAYNELFDHAQIIFSLLMFLLYVWVVESLKRAPRT